MNGKRAKALRNLARSLTVGMPDAEYQNINRKNKIYKALDRNGKEISIPIPTYTRVLIDNCTRKVYQRLKVGRYQLGNQNI